MPPTTLAAVAAAAAAAAQWEAGPLQREAGSAGRAETTESDSEDDKDIGPGDWDDILAVWMTAVGLPNLGEEAQPDSASETSGSSSEDEDPPGT